MNRTKLNYIVDLILTTLFLGVAGTGLLMYFFMPSGIPRGKYVVYMGLTKATWVWIHSRAGILMTIIIVVHLILHWHWIVYTTRNFFRKRKEKTEITEICEPL
ncbi:DUF4405 domain-containing protein [Methanosarcina sp. KYL-1]|nr:DUF4405 domain-containing protein [Methanosarcina sp. KYL-1]MCQ1536787.1 DUF4405 domain-containing protein [Methanosarcina sp. KYL-1]